MPAAARRNANRARVTGPAPKELATPTQAAIAYTNRRNALHAQGLCAIDGCGATVQIEADGFGGLRVHWLCAEHEAKR